MDYVDDISRPRFQFQSRPSAPQTPPETLLKIGKLPAASCFAAALLLLIPTLYLSDNHQPLAFLLLWTSLSLLLGPFAPPSLTGGDPLVGRGELLPPSPEPQTPPDPPARRVRSYPPAPIPAAVRSEKPLPPPRTTTIVDGSDQEGIGGDEEEEKEWNDEDFEILKKQILKHPVGAARRWERIAEAFGGRHGLESVIRTAKSLSEKRPGAGDSFAQFLKQRKPLDKRAETIDGDSNGSVSTENCDPKREAWSAGEDIALLNALKAFPKDVALRWEKITAAVPGKSKASCLKRVAELKRDFRSSKASET